VTDAGTTNKRPFLAILGLVLWIVMLVVLHMMDWREPSGLGTVAVSVTVRQDGKPIANAIVSLFPRSGSSAMRPAAGTTGANGRCDLTTLRFDDGAMPGSYAVSVWKPSAESLRDVNNLALLDVDPSEPPSGAGAMYANPGAMAVMARAGNQDPDPDALPAHLSDPDTSGLKAIVRVDGENDFTFVVEQ
jgi:hypothetical protein